MIDTTDYEPFTSALLRLVAGRAPVAPAGQPPLSKLEILSYWDACEDLELDRVLLGIANAAKSSDKFRPMAPQLREFALAARPMTPLKVLPEWKGPIAASPEQVADVARRIRAQFTRVGSRLGRKGPHITAEAAREGLVACEANANRAAADHGFTKRRWQKTPTGSLSQELLVHMARHKSDEAHWRGLAAWHREQLDQHERKGA